jgi:hypothetical protein
MDRTAALNYAEKDWDRPSKDDGQIMVLDGDGVKQVSKERKRLDVPEMEGWEARFVYNGSTDHAGDEAVFIKAVPAGDPSGLRSETCRAGGSREPSKSGPASRNASPVRSHGLAELRWRLRRGPMRSGDGKRDPDAWHGQAL